MSERFLQLSALRLGPVFALALDFRQNGLAACKILASKQNISEGYGAKVHQARAFQTSLLLSEKPGQFQGTAGFVEMAW